MKKKRKVIAAMSGGVDSSVAAALLKNIGYDVVGVFMKFWSETLISADKNADLRGSENRCCSIEAQMDARRVASKLKIPFYVIDVRKEFKKRVVDYFVDEYKKGRTPNPCVECNRWIKFKFLLEKMMQLKADYIATGHYARKNQKSKIKSQKLLVAKDEKKDQSYFLWQLNQKQLSKILFPIGDYTKKEVREMAKKFGLPVYEKKESQEICFATNIYEFLKSRIHANEGDIIDVDGKKVGEHEGLYLYTIGQRKGIKIGGIGPFYVVDKDFKKNALIVAQSDFNEALFKKEFTANEVNWINKVKFPLKCSVKIRYLTKSVPCTVYKIQATKYKIQFSAPQRAITPGQSAVFYKRNQVLGGGVIM